MRHHMTARGPIPFTAEEEAEWDAKEASATKNANAEKVAQRRQAILADLQAIDTRSIRALREGNQQRIAELEAQAVALRAELAAL